MRYHFTLLLILGWLASLPAQPSGNPFELTHRLPTPVVDSNLTPQTGNPFDLVNPVTGPAPTGQAEPATPGPIVVQPTDPDEGKGALLSIHLVLLLSMASLWVLFRGLLTQCLAGTVNDSLMTQLYRRRSGGQLSALWLCYVFFFLAAGYFIYLLALYHDVSLRLGVWSSWLTYALVVAAAVGLKHWVLWAFGRIYPIRKELSRYAFVLMVFSILAGLLLVPVNLLVSYAPESWRPTFLYGGLLLLGLIYLLHLLRGLFIANRFALRRPVHFLLYICAIEIAPLVLVYRYLSDSLI